MYTILKQFIKGADIWVAKLSDTDPEYTYDTLEEAETAIITLTPQYPNNPLKVSQKV